MSFDDDEKSVAHNRPTELIDIALPTVTYRIACGPRDVQFGMLLYVATPSARTEITPMQVSGNQGSGLTISLPVTHAVVSRWFKAGVPPRQTVVTVSRKQERSQVIERIWGGLVTSIACSGNIAKLLVPSLTMDTMQRTLPTISSGQSCPWTLYDPATCRSDRALFESSTTAILVDGRTVRASLGSLTRNGDWAEDGELLHVASGERMTIGTQRDLDPGVSDVADLDMERVIPDLKTGDAIIVYAGCKKSVAVCLAKFANVNNFGGSPNAPTRNPFLYTERLL